MAESEAEAIERELQALQARADELASSPEIEGSAVEAIRFEEVADINARLEALRARIERYTKRPIEALEAEQPRLAWLARRSRRFGFLTAILPPLIWVAGAFVGPDRDVQLPFFEAAVQVIPILVLAAAIEGRAFQIEANSRIPAMQTFYALSLFVIVIGEAAALWALGLGEGTDLLFVLTVCGLLNAGTAVVVLALVGRD